MSTKCQKISVPFISFFSNTGQSQSGTIVYVVFKRFRGIIAKVCLIFIHIPIAHHCDCRKEAIHSGTDWNFSSCKFRFIREPLIMVDLKLIRLFLFKISSPNPNSPMSLPFKVKKMHNLFSESSTRPHPKTLSMLCLRLGRVAPSGNSN
jgi:hypothetical protein